MATSSGGLDKVSGNCNVGIPYCIKITNEFSDKCVIQCSVI
jgi:hypothetical protein